MPVDNRVPLIFTHYGNAEYLGYTLRQATRSNPALRRILIGDETNLEIAIASGWEHLFLSELMSEQRDLFNARFRWIQGPNHQPIKGKKDWLRFVFERFFCISTFFESSDHQYFWHFDSDTMVLHDLDRYATRIRSQDVACTTLCNDFCPSGLISTHFLAGYCSSIIRKFCDEQNLRDMQREYSEHRKNDAYTEMPAFCDYREDSGIKTLHLAAAFAAEGVWFDNCICQPESFATFPQSNGARPVKSLRSESGKIFCSRDGIDLEFATINCSWVPIKVFQWIENAVVRKSSGHTDLLVRHFPTSGRSLLKRFVKPLIPWRLLKALSRLFTSKHS